MKLFVTPSILALSLLLVASGASVSVAGGPFNPTLGDIQDFVFTPTCAASFCHGAAMSAGLHLEEGASYGSLVNVASAELPTWLRVKPFDPDNSYLICKLEACPQMVASQMPLIGGPLSQDVIDVIRQWIADGAKDDDPISVEASSFGRIKAFYR